MSDINKNPTLENVISTYHTHAREPSEWAKKQGAILSIFGGSDCPWCGNYMTSKTLGSMIGICSENKSHVVEWVPWGG